MAGHGPPRSPAAMLCVLLVGGLALVGALALRQPFRSATGSMTVGWMSSNPTSASTHPAGSPPPASSAEASKSTWRVVGLGDSVTSGAGCTCQTFVGRYADITARRLDRTVMSRDLGVSGLTSSGLLDQLRTDQVAAASVAQANIVLVTIGANDVAGAMREWADGQCDQSCFTTTTATMHDRVVQVLARILALRDGRPTEVLLTTYWNVVVDGAVARQEFSTQYLQVSDALTRQADRALCDAVRSADERPAGGTPGGEVLCVDLYAPFKGTGEVDPTPLLAADGDHPDSAGHQLIAETLASNGWAPLGVAS